jgi:hypothetical protein
MAELLIPQEDGTVLTIKVQINGTGIVTNPEEQESSNG